jgi:diguanylate cyclase (GGDEF)-like protein
MTPPEPHHSTESLAVAPQVLPSPEAAPPIVRRLRLVPRPSGLPAAPPREGAVEDRDVLLSAIKAKLKASVEEQQASMPVAKRREVAARTRVSVLECVAALDRLHLSVTADALRARQRRLDAFDVQAAPAPNQAAPGTACDNQMRRRKPGSPGAFALLPNRSGLARRLRQALDQAALQAQPFAVLALDLEGFQPIQAALGSDAGDELLGIVAARLVRAVRSQDMVSRLRGDEFGLFITTVASHEQLRRLTCKLFDTVTAPIAIDRVQVSVRPNIGIGVGQTDGASGAHLIRNAYVALGHARRQKMGFAFYDERGMAWVPGRI